MTKFTPVAAVVVAIGVMGATRHAGPAHVARPLHVSGRSSGTTAERGASGTAAATRAAPGGVEIAATEVLADGYDGRQLLGPNDVRVDAVGRLFFTDGGRPPFVPRYTPGPNARPPVAGTGVYRVDPDGRVHRVLGSPTVRQPNGLGISPDRRWLYVLENDLAPGGLRQLLRFDLSAEGDASNRRVLHDFTPGRSGDGMIVDAAGTLLVAAGVNRPG